LTARYVPNQGDIVWLNFTPQSGHEQAGHRPALVLSPKAYNDKTDLMLCCPITSQSKGYPFEVQLEGIRGITGVVLADQLKSLDWAARKAEYKGKVTAEIMHEVLAKIQALLEYAK
jgi:mRNA interferase MazF